MGTPRLSIRASVQAHGKRRGGDSSGVDSASRCHGMGLRHKGWPRKGLAILSGSRWFSLFGVLERSGWGSLWGCAVQPRQADGPAPLNRSGSKSKPP